MKTSILPSLFLAFSLLFANTVSAEVTPITPADTIVYAVFVRGDDVNGTYREPVSETMSMERSEQFQFYKPNSSIVRVFSPKMLVAMSPMPTESFVKLVLTSDKADDTTLVPGARWTARVSRPPAADSRCISNVDVEVSVTITNIGTENVLIDGQLISVKTITASQEGWWSINMCGSGKFASQVRYSPELDVVLSAENTIYVRNYPNGDKIVLSEIRRNTMK